MRTLIMPIIPSAAGLDKEARKNEIIHLIRVGGRVKDGQEKLLNHFRFYKEITATTHPTEPPRRDKAT